MVEADVVAFKPFWSALSRPQGSYLVKSLEAIRVETTAGLGRWAIAVQVVGIGEFLVVYMPFERTGAMCKDLIQIIKPRATQRIKSGMITLEDQPGSPSTVDLRNGETYQRARVGSKSKTGSLKTSVASSSGFSTSKSSVIDKSNHRLLGHTIT